MFCFFFCLLFVSVSSVSLCFSVFFVHNTGLPITEEGEQDTNEEERANIRSRGRRSGGGGGDGKWSGGQFGGRFGSNSG